MKNESPYFVQVHKNFIVRCESIHSVRWDESEKKYMIQIGGATFTIDKEDGARICESVGIRATIVRKIFTKKCKTKRTK